MSDLPKEPERRFRSAVSGLWYERASAAGTVDAVELFGERLYREPGEHALPFIRRVAAWSSNLHLSKEAKP